LASGGGAQLGSVLPISTEGRRNKENETGREGEGSGAGARMELVAARRRDGGGGGGEAQGQDSYRRSGGAGAVRLPGAREMREDDGGLRQRRKRGERDYADLWAPSDSAG
jgi:hypothetical protein